MSEMMEADEIRTDIRIYKASAGSGKTWTLVKEYLRLVLAQPERYRSVLAITFTNKAAGEMKERIIRALRDLAAEQDEDLLRVILAETTLSAKRVRENAQKVLTLILHDYGNFAVRTIDSFMHRLVKQFASDLELPSKFDVETDGRGLIERMSDRLLDAIGQDEYITQILMDFTTERLRDEDGWQVERDITSVSQELVNETAREPISRLRDLEPEQFFQLIEWLREQREGYPKELKARAQALLNQVEAAGLSRDDFAGKGNSFVRALEKMVEANKMSDIKSAFASKSLQNAVEEGKWVTKGARPEAMDLIMGGGLGAALTELVDWHQEQAPRYISAELIWSQVHSLAVLRQVEDLVEEYKQDHQVVLIQDFQRKVADFISEEQPDYIYWRLGERYRHYLIDEFQDTSRIQWNNLKPLFEYITAEPEREGSLLLVGDSKQAIYRWRGGDTMLFEADVPVELGIEPTSLDTNWRSGEAIVSFNNRLFGKIAEIAPDRTGVDLIYQDFSQKFRESKIGAGLVRIEFFDRCTKAEHQELAFERLSQLLPGLQADGFHWRDICILVRKGAEGSEVGKFLAEQGIPFLSSDSLLLYKEPSVAFLISLFEFLNDPILGIPRTEALHYYLAYIQGLDADQVSVELRKVEKEEKPWAVVADRFPEEFRKLRLRQNRLPLYELTEELIRIFGLGERNGAYMQQFLDEVLNYSQRKKPDLAGFLEYWEERKEQLSVVTPPGENAVEIMTVHKSKGLEFPVVILPFLDWGISPHAQQTMWAQSGEALGGFSDTFLVKMKKDLLESEFSESFRKELDQQFLDTINLLYVAFTRPSERLYAFTQKRYDKQDGKLELESYRGVQDVIGEAMKDKAFDLVGEVYETGFPLPAEGDEGNIGLYPVEAMPSQPWRDRLHVERRFRRHWGGAQTEEGQDEVLLAGELLRRVEHSDDLDRALRDSVEQGQIAKGASKALRKRLEALLSGEGGQYFGPEWRKLHQVQLLGVGELPPPDRLAVRDGLAVAMRFARQGELDEAAKALLRWLEGARDAAAFEDLQGLLLDLDSGDWIALS